MGVRKIRKKVRKILVALSVFCLDNEPAIL